MEERLTLPRPATQAGPEAAALSPETVMRDWKLAQAWLRHELSGGKPDES